MNYTFSEFWAALQKCRQMNTDYNGGFFSIDAAAVLFSLIRDFAVLEQALEQLEISENPNTAIWSEVKECYLAADANEQGYSCVREYIRTFPEAHRIGHDRWLLRCE